MSDRFAGFVISHHRQEILERTLGNLLSQSRAPERLLVVDNASSPATRALAERWAGRGVSYLDAGDNLGPPGAAALAIERLLEGPWAWIYWGDDDDPPRTEDTLERLLALAAEGGAREIGALGAVGALWDARRGRLVRLPDDRLAGPVEVDMVAGGSQWILRAAALRAIGPPDARLFFGLEDLEYCLRLRRAGYRVLVDGDLMRTYRELTGRLNLESRPRVRPGDPPQALWRQYYSTRNYIFMMARTFGAPRLAWRRAGLTVVKAALAWTRGPRYGARYTALQLRAIGDGFRGRMGRTLAPEGR